MLAKAYLLIFVLFYFSQKGEIHKMLIVVERKGYKTEKTAFKIILH